MMSTLALSFAHLLNLLWSSVSMVLDDEQLALSYAVFLLIAGLIVDLCALDFGRRH